MPCMRMTSPRQKMVWAPKDTYVESDWTSLDEGQFKENELFHAELYAEVARFAVLRWGIFHKYDNLYGVGLVSAVFSRVHPCH